MNIDINCYIKNRLAQLISDSDERKRVAVIGAGTSGLIACHKLLNVGLYPILFEKTDDSGGIWSPSGHPAVYHGLVMNTSPKLTTFKDQLGPEPDCGLHYSAQRYVNYVKNYFSNKNVYNHILFCTKIQGIEVDPSGGGYISLLTNEDFVLARRLRFSHIIYAGGLCLNAKNESSDLLKNYKGAVFHSSNIQEIKCLYQKKILVIGGGNTASDIASRFHKDGAVVDISVRNKTWFLPRCVENLPIDEFVGALKRDFGMSYKYKVLESLYDNDFFSNFNSNEEIDFRKHRISISDQLPLFVKNKEVKVNGRIRGAEGKHIFFENGNYAHYDVVINCTGYGVDLYAGISDSKKSLLAEVMSPDFPGWWFIGAPAVWGGSPALAEYQADIIASGIKKQISSITLSDLVKKIGGYERSMLSLPFGFKALDFYDYALFSSKLFEEINRK